MAIAEDLLRPRCFHDNLEAGRKPTGKEICAEWLNSVNIFAHKESFYSLIMLSHYVLCIFIAGRCLPGNLTFSTAGWFIAFLFFTAHFYHTFWYHRYCSHKAFVFSSKLFPLLVQWTNPLLIKEEAYVIPHFVHHKLSDSPHDPYGPHLGAAGSILAFESAHHFNRMMNEHSFAHCRKLLSHIPSVWQDREDFVANGSFEAPWIYLLRFLVVNLFWITLFAWFLRKPALLGAWYAAALVFTIILRDFNYRGHAEDANRETKLDKQSLAVNQWFYGYFASEWHDNHHRFSASARCGFRTFELDLSFVATRLLKQLGIISSFVDSTKSFTATQTEPAPLKPAKNVRFDAVELPPTPTHKSAPDRVHNEDSRR